MNLDSFFNLFFVSNFQCFHITPFYFWEHMVLSWSNMRVLLASPADFFLWKVKTFLKKISRFQHFFINRNSEIELRSYNTYYPDVLDSFCLSFLIDHVLNKHYSVTNLHVPSISFQDFDQFSSRLSYKLTKTNKQTK